MQLKIPLLANIASFQRQSTSGSAPLIVPSSAACDCRSTSPPTAPTSPPCPRCPSTSTVRQASPLVGCLLSRAGSFGFVWAEDCSCELLRAVRGLPFISTAVSPHSPLESLRLPRPRPLTLPAGVSFELTARQYVIQMSTSPPQCVLGLMSFDASGVGLNMWILGGEWLPCRCSCISHRLACCLFALAAARTCPCMRAVSLPASSRHRSAFSFPTLVSCVPMQTPSSGPTTASSTATPTWCASPRPSTTRRSSCCPTAPPGKQATTRRFSFLSAVVVALSWKVLLLLNGRSTVDGLWAACKRSVQCTGHVIS